MWKWIKRFLGIKDKEETKPPILDVPVESGDSLLMQMIKHFEGCYLHAYKDSAGIWTIGYGTIIYPDGLKVKEGHKCSMYEALKWLQIELDEKRGVLEEHYFTHNLHFTDYEKDALLCFAYNLGEGIVTDPRRSMGSAVMDEDSEEIIDAFHLYKKAGGRTIAGLVRRRKSEAHLFEHGTINFFE